MDADPSGAGPRDPGMEARVARAEDQFTRVEALLRGIDERTRRLETDGAELRALLGGMDEQTRRLETLLRSTDDRVRRLEVDVAELKGRIVNLPTTWAMITTMIGGQITLAGLVLVILKAFATR